MQADKKIEISVKGKLLSVDTVTIDNMKLVTTGNFIKTTRLEDEWFADIEEPARVTEALKRIRPKPDIFTFWQRPPENAVKHDYRLEWESVAALPITSYEHWWKNQINAKTRNLARKAEKMGVVVKQAVFDDDFIKGVTEVFNESPIRQGKPFWHYGKDFDTVKREFSRYLFREDVFGAYYDGKLIGFIFLAYSDRYALFTQIISKIEHRDKATNNALIAKAVEVCAEKGIPLLIYAMWNEGSLADFKKHNGFQKMDLPRYYCPVSLKGRLAVRLNLHRGAAALMPEGIKDRLKALRKKWYAGKT